MFGLNFDQPLIMSRIFTIITCVFLWGLFMFTPIAWSQSTDNEAIVTSIKSGSSKEISHLFGQSVELSINGNQGDYSKNQAELVLRDFFKKFPPSDFDIVHKGKSGNQIQYLIGTYLSNGITFRVLIKTKVSGESKVIYSMEFNKE